MKNLIKGAYVIVLFVALILFFRPLLGNDSINLEDNYNESQVTITATPRTIVWPFNSCITVSWETDKIKNIYLSDAGVIGWGEQQICQHLSDVSFQVIFPDDSEKYYDLPFQFVTRERQIILVIIIITLIGTLNLQHFLNITYRINNVVTRIDNKIHRLVSVIFILICIIMAFVGMSYIVLLAFTTNTAITWDETYYASIASTGAHGIGIYPYVQGFDQIPFQGGVGVAAYLYVIAYQILGPSIWSLRLVSILASFIGLTGIFVITRKWYGILTALVAIAIIPYMYLFIQSNSIRMDSITIAYLAWALVLFSFAWNRKDQIFWHIITGFVFGVGLQAHIHSMVIAFACGLLYLSDTLTTIYRTRQYSQIFKSPMTGYIIGYSIGLLSFFVITVLPNPDAFFRSAGLARIGTDANGVEASYTLNNSRLFESFLSPGILLAKEEIRYTQLLKNMPGFELILWVLALFSLFATRHHKYDKLLRVLFAGSILSSAFILNSSSTLYLGHVLPILLLPLAPFVVYGFIGASDRGLKHVSILSLIFLLMLFAASLQTYTTLPKIQEMLNNTEIEPEPELFQQVKNIASPNCKIAGNPKFYIPYFLEYPMFIGVRSTEYQIGSSYYGLYDQPVEYWKQKQPDLIFGLLDFGLDKYVEDLNYIQVTDEIWIKPDNRSEGCELNIPNS